MLLVGEITARPDGLERALVRAGFEIAEVTASAVRDLSSTDAVLVTANHEPGAAATLDILERIAPVGLPILVAMVSSDRGAVVRLLARGAADILLPPLEPAEICARLAARVRAGGEAAHARLLADQASKLFDAFQDIAAALRPEETLQALAQHVGHVLELSHCACLLWTPGQTRGRLVALHENPRLRDEDVDLSRYPEVEEAVRTGETVYVADARAHPVFLRTRDRSPGSNPALDVESAAAIPLLRQGLPVGAVVLRTRRGQPLGAAQLRFAERLVRGTARVWESQERLAAIVRRQGVQEARDPLTSCGSLDALDRRLQEEVERARRYGLSFSLVLLDVDGLAQLNQRHGSETGDRVLADIGALLQQEIRAPDFVARYGGDEFALILPETTVDGARFSIARVRHRVAQHSFTDLSAAERPLLSAGVVAFPQPAALHPRDLLALVETALQSGKNGAPDRIGAA